MNREGEQVIAAGKAGAWDRALGWAVVAMGFGLPFYIAISQNLFILAALIWIADQVRRKRCDVARTPMDVGFVAYFAAELISLPFSTNLPQSLIYLRRFLLIGMVYLMGAAIRDWRWLRRALWAFLGGAALYSIWGLAFFIRHPDLRVRHIHNSITAGGITFLAAGLALSLCFAPGKREWKWLCGGTALLASLCLFLTNTRGSMLGLLAAASVLLAVRRPRLLLALPVVIALAYATVPSSQKERIRGFFDPNWESNRNRLTWWKTGLEIFRDHPIVGIGDVGTEKMYVRYRPNAGGKIAGHMHNNFLHIAVTLGTIGLAGFSFMLWRVFQFLWRAYRAAHDPLASSLSLGAFALFLGFNVNGLFEWNFGDQEVVTILWFIIGLTLASWRIGLSQQPEAGQPSPELPARAGAGEVAA